MNQGYARGYAVGFAGKEKNNPYPKWCREFDAYEDGYRTGSELCCVAEATMEGGMEDGTES